MKFWKKKKQKQGRIHWSIPHQGFIPTHQDVIAPQEGRSHYLQSFHVSYNQNWVGLMTLTVGGEVKGRWYCHSHRDIAFNPPMPIDTWFSGWIHAGPRENEPEDLSGTVTLVGYTDDI